MIKQENEKQAEVSKINFKKVFMMNQSLLRSL
jgi:hypothetical protein